jgi:hypothetical protein
MQLDRSVFSRQSFDSAADHQSVYRNMSWKERGEAFRYLIAVNYGFRGKSWPRMDKTVFKNQARR